MTNDQINKSEADLWNKMYSAKASPSAKKVHYNPLNQTGQASTKKNEADLLNNLYSKAPVQRNIVNKVSDIFKNKKFYFISAASLLVIIGIGSFFLIKGNLFSFIKNRSVSYTKNPAVKEMPLNSVVKIIVEKDTDREASGSGILFTSDGYILTNAHVITTPLGKSVKDIKVCYSSNNNQDVKCEYDAFIVDANRADDMAVIKVDKQIQEIAPYPLVVQEDDESWTKEILPLGAEIKAIGYPGVGGNSITITKGIVSGYKNGEIIFDDGTLQKIPYYIKTDTEINYGNSGGAVFDSNNRYIGISSAMSKDDGGKLSLVIYWNKINLYLNHLIFKGVIKLPEKQYVKRHIASSESDLWSGIKAYFRGDYKTAIDSLDRYTQAYGADSRGWSYLCNAYKDTNELEKMETCAERLRAIKPQAQALSWYFTSYYNSTKENDNNKAYDSISKALSSEPENTMLLARKADLEVALNKYEDAKKTAGQMLRIDETNSDAWYYTGLVALKEEDYESGIKYLELSFNITPDASIASYLADLYNSKYSVSEDIKDLTMSLIYRVNSVVINQHNVGDILALAGSVTTVFENDKAGTWASSLKLVREILQKLEVDKSLIDPVGGVTDADIKEYLTSIADKNEEIKQQDIDAVRYFVKMTMAWLYTFIDEKIACAAQFNEIGKSDLVKVLIDSGFETTDASNVISRSATLECLCKNDDYSNDIINKCYSSKIKQILNK